MPFGGGLGGLEGSEGGVEGLPGISVTVSYGTLVHQGSQRDSFGSEGGKIPDWWKVS